VGLELRPRALAADREADRRPVVGRPGGGLDVGRDPEPEQPPLLAGTRLLGAEALVVDELERALERLARGHALERRAAQHLARLLVGRDEVPPPDLRGIDAQLACD